MATVVASVNITVALPDEATEKGYYMSVTAAKKSTVAENVGTNAEYPSTSSFLAGETAYFLVYHHPDVSVSKIISTYGTPTLHESDRTFNACEVLQFNKTEDTKSDSDTYNEASVSNSIASSTFEWITAAIPVQLAEDYKTYRSQVFNLAIARIAYNTKVDIYKLQLPAQIPATTLTCPEATDEYPIALIFIGTAGA